MYIKIIIISIAVIIAGEVAYFLFQPFSLFQNNKKNAELADGVSALMQYLSETLHWMNFSEIQATEMQWNVVKNGTAEKLILVGKGFKAEGINNQSYKDLKDFFDKLHNEFELDFFNTGSGSITEYVGYRRKRNDIICTVAGQMQNREDVEYMEKEPIWDAVVKCAKPPTP